jgi:hypothetical protein
MIGHAGFRENRANANFFPIGVGRNLLGGHILTELRLLLVGNAANDRTRDTAYRGADRTTDDSAANGARCGTRCGAAGLSEGASRSDM